MHQIRYLYAISVLTRKGCEDASSHVWLFIMLTAMFVDILISVLDAAKATIDIYSMRGSCMLDDFDPLGLLSAMMLKHAHTSRI